MMGISKMPKYDYQDIGYFTKNESNEPFDLYSDESSDITQRIESNFGISRKKHGTSFVIFHLSISVQKLHFL